MLAFRQKNGKEKGKMPENTLTGALLMLAGFGLLAYIPRTVVKITCGDKLAVTEILTLLLRYALYIGLSAEAVVVMAMFRTSLPWYLHVWWWLEIAYYGYLEDVLWAATWQWREERRLDKIARGNGFHCRLCTKSLERKEPFRITFLEVKMAAGILAVFGAEAFILTREPILTLLHAVPKEWSLIFTIFGFPVLCVVAHMALCLFETAERFIWELRYVWDRRRFNQG